MTMCRCCGDMLRGGMGRRRFLARMGAGVVAGVGAAAMMPGRLRAAEGHYAAMLLTCIDPRFPEASLAFMRGRGLAGQYSQFTFAGAAIGAVAPAFSAWHQTFWDNLSTSIELHHIPKVIAMDHRDCGAAKIAFGAEQVANRDTETDTHRKVLAEFRAQVAQRHPGLQVETGLMDLDGSVLLFA